MSHLWEIDHPYYCTEGNYHAKDRHQVYESWAEFVENGWFDSDPDMNLLFRWDWMSWRRHPDPDLRSDRPDELLLFFVLQRKADHYSMSVCVTDDDEPAVRAWLEERAKTIAAIWEPITLVTGEQAGAVSCG